MNVALPPRLDTAEPLAAAGAESAKSASVAIRVVVCDDEPLAVRRIQALLARLEAVELVGATESAAEAVAMIQTLKPDVVILDIEMPEMDGFDVIDSLTRDEQIDRHAPLVIFVTAFRNLAADAYDSGVIDFLSKPVRLHRLEKAIARARASRDAREATERLEVLSGRLDALRTGDEHYRNAHVWVSRRGETVRVDLNYLDRVAAEGAYVRLHVDANSYLHREAIGTIEEQLNPERFVRVHRSHLVRADQVVSIRRTMHGASELMMRSGERIPLGRKYAKEARRRLLQRDQPSIG